jgi:hypothetical protein
VITVAIGQRATEAAKGDLSQCVADVEMQCPGETGWPAEEHGA